MKLMGYKVYTCGHGKNCCRDIALTNPAQRRIEKKRQRAIEKRAWKRDG
jgi:hypothetical protein